MLKVTTKSREDEYFDVYINGKLFDNITTFFAEHIYFCSSYQEFTQLISYPFFELASNQIEKITCDDNRSFIDTNYFLTYEIGTTYSLVDDLEVRDEEQKTDTEETSLNDEGNYVLIKLNFRYDEWKKPYNIKEYMDLIYSKIILNDVLNANWFRNKPFDAFDAFDSLILEFTNIGDAETPLSCIEKFNPIIGSLLRDGIIEMDNQYSLDVYSTYFNFPPAYKTSCKQYLMYFAQFLLDLGISVNTEVKDTPEGTFFSVIPQDKNEAIKNIKELLAVYMDAPNNLKDNELVIHQSDIAITQLQANILHLKSQLAFANTQIEMKQAIIQLKDATIQSLNLNNYQLSEKIQHQTQKDEESIIPGFLSVKEVEKYGVKIKLPEILRRLKRKL